MRWSVAQCEDQMIWMAGFLLNWSEWQPLVEGGAAALEGAVEAWLMTVKAIRVWLIVAESTITISSTVNLRIWRLMAVPILCLARLSFFWFLHKNLPVALQRSQCRRFVFCNTCCIQGQCCGWSWRLKDQAYWMLVDCQQRGLATIHNGRRSSVE